MSGLKLAFTLAGSAYATGKYMFSGEGDLEDDDFPPLSPCNSYSSSSSYNGGTTWIQTRQSHRPPPPSLSYTHRPPATNAYSQTTARSPVLSGHSRGVHHPGVPYTGTPSQSQPSSTRTQASRLYSSFFHTDHVRGSPEYEGEDGYEDNNDYKYQSEDEYDYVYGYQSEDDYGYQDEDEDEYRHKDEDGYRYGYGYEEEDESQTGDEYEYFQTTPHVPSHVYAGGKPHLLIAPVGGVSSPPRSDDPAGIENLAFAKKLRKQARRKGREMSEAYRRAESARRKGRFGVAHTHTQDAIAHESEMEKLDERAAKIFFRENNKNRREDGEIDLHGLYVAEAIQVAEDQVQIARWRGDEDVRFIVGKGLHSGTGEAKIRPALGDLFTERGLEHSLDPYNTGVLVVLLD
ncbi:hypothetical protein EDB83DRAFT_27060 [Lactarius deliciosus]|nr:hypothetical protein EDB83DRAFT_27060 [Lactarius deliciosus]